MLGLAKSLKIPLSQRYPKSTNGQSVFSVASEFTPSAPLPAFPRIRWPATQKYNRCPEVQTAF